jgi:D-glycero-D-manno-heptose 1,7-bisphosphate phosphatase
VTETKSLTQRIAIIDLLGTLGGEGLADIRGFAFYDFAIEALQKINALNMNIVIYTNHSRIAKGVLTMEDFLEEKARLLSILQTADIHIDDFIVCPHTPQDGCDCRKPKTGLINNYLRDRPPVDLKGSFVIGDIGASDMLLARNLGCRGILVLTGDGRKSLTEARSVWAGYKPYAVCGNVLEAARVIEGDMSIEHSLFNPA